MSFNPIWVRDGYISGLATIHPSGFVNKAPLIAGSGRYQILMPDLTGNEEFPRVGRSEGCSERQT